MGTATKDQETITIQELLDRPLVTSKDLRDHGYNPGLLSYYESKGLIERVGRGLYRNATHPPEIDFQWEDLAYTVLSIPNGVVTGVSALALYDITEEIPRQHWIAVPHDTSIGKRPNTRIVRQRNHELGISSISVGDIEIPIYNLERTLVDAFRLLSIEAAIKALKAAFKSTDHKPDMKKLSHYAKELRANIDEYILMVTT